MPNSYFQFKQFRINQDQCAMKVCTDSCLFGAWTAHWLLTENKLNTNILDIGAGTGLLSLMLAQTLTNAKIDGVEMDEHAARQAVENVIESPWQDRLRIINQKIQDFSPGKKYDVIISNPPFYANSLASGNKAKDVAHHSTQLSLPELLFYFQKNLCENGIFSVVLPYARSEEWERMEQQAGFYLIKKALVRQTEQHSFFRTFMIFGRQPVTGISADIISIRNAQNQYTPEFISLLKPYYLYL